MASLEEATTLSASQMAFFADDELITIIPSEPLPELNLVSGTFGPFVPAEETKVPLWLAARLRQRHQCTIVPPAWLSVEHLERVNKAHLRPQTDAEKEALRLPYRWREIAHRLLAVAQEDIRQAAAVSNEIDHLWTKRSNEMRNNLVLLATDGGNEFLYVAITDLQVGSMELNTVRPFFIETASQLYSLNALAATVSGGDRNSAGQSADPYASQPTPSTRLRGEDGAPLSKQFRSDTLSQ